MENRSLSGQGRVHIDIPKLDVSRLRNLISGEDADRVYAEVENRPKTDWRKFVADVEEHPERLGHWDMSMSFEEFARRVKAGEYD